MQLTMMLSVDLDMPMFSVKVRDFALARLVKTLDQLQVSGAMTWFINDNDFALTRDHQPFLRDVLDRGDAIGSHEHVDYLDGDWTEVNLRPFIEQSVRGIQHWLAREGRPSRLRVHRFGCLFQNPIAYRIVQELGFDVHSDVCPTVRHPNHMQNLSFDNTMVPLGVWPYRHDAEGITDWRTDAGPLLQIPVLQATLTANWWDKLEPRIVQAWVDGAAKLGRDQAAASFCFHPFEMTRGYRLDDDAFQRLAWVVTFLRDQFGATFMNMEQFAARV